MFHNTVQHGNLRMSTKKPEPVDVLVGRNIRIRRLALNMSQGKLGKAIGVSFQQIQKYEHGANRVGASRLMQISRELNISVSSFFDGARGLEITDNALDESPTSFLIQADALWMARAFSKLDDVKLRRSLVILAENLITNGSSRK
jgi:transcriptional regulator with XRE-family HTH domain